MPNYYEEIAKNIFYRVKAGIPLDKDFRQMVLDLVIKEEGHGDLLEEIFLKTCILNDSFDCIFLQRQIFEMNNPFSSFLNDFENEFYYYLFVTRFLLKNIYIFFQEKNSNNEPLEIKLLKVLANYKMNLPIIYSYFHLKKSKLHHSKKRKYKAISLLSPEKREAMIASFESIFEITAFLEQEKINTINKILFCENSLHSYRYLQFLQSTKKEQEIELSPTCYYFEQIVGRWQSKNLKEQQYYFDAIKRLKLGLVLSEHEIDKIKEMKRELKKDLLVK